MAAQPPFGITHFSRELPLRFEGDGFRLKRNNSAVAFVSGVERLEDGSVVFAYGSRDSSARVLTMNTAELEALF